MPASIEQITRDEQRVSFQPGDSYLFSYREFIRYFEGVEVITAHHLVLGAHLAYGWMPTILEMNNIPDNLEDAVEVLNAVKRAEAVGVAELTALKNTINNSLVGTSKLLHFINPHSYAIWDRWVFRYINGRNPHHYQVNDPRKYLAYLDLCNEISQNKGFPPIHASMNRKIGYPVTAYRALELVMFMSSRE